MELLMGLLSFFEGKESSYRSLSHSRGLYFAKDTGVILFKGVKYGSKPDLSNYATKSDISSLRSELGNKADSNHKHTIDDISDLIIADSNHDGLMSASDKQKLDNSLKEVEPFGSVTANSLTIHFREFHNSGLINTTGSGWTIGSATQLQAGLMSARDKQKLDSISNPHALSVQPLNDSSEISPASLIGSDRYDILKGITDKHIGVNAQFTDGKLTIGLYDFNNSEWVGAPSVTIPLQ